MRLKVLKMLIIAVCIIGVIGFIYMDEKAKPVTSDNQTAFQIGNEMIYTWHDGEEEYLFLPSYADANDVQIPENGNLQILTSENLPTIFLETDSGTLENIWSDKEVEENGKITIYDKDGNLEISCGLKTVKGRGNYSFANYEKKPIAIETKEEVSLLGQGLGKNYALLSNASDPTLIRNDIARRMEKELAIEYDNCGVFADVYANGEYIGTYYLCENIEVGPERININWMEAQMDQVYQHSNYDSLETYEEDGVKGKVMEVNPKDITGGYLVERDFKDRFELEYDLNPSTFITKQEEHFVVKSPRYCSAEQITYIQQYFNEAEAAILNKDGMHPETGISYEEYIDAEAFVKKYLVEEVTKNYDAGVSSAFYYKDSDAVDGRIKPGPVWDCDMSFGNYLDWMEYFSKDPEGISKLAFHDHKTPWFEALYEKEEFYHAVCETYEKEVSPFLQKLLNEEIEFYKNELEASAKMNEIRWKVDFDNNQYYENRGKSFDVLRVFVQERKNFLDREWIK